MKRTISFFILFISIFTLSLAHSGRTDSNGGHYDHSTGEYHYHNNGDIQTDDDVYAYEIDLSDEKYVDKLEKDNEKLQDELHEINSKIYNLNVTSIDELDNTISKQSNEIKSLKSSKSNMWIVFTFVVFLVGTITYNIGLSKNINNRYERLGKIVMKGLGSNDIEKAIKDTSEFYKSQGIDIK